MARQIGRALALTLKISDIAAMLDNKTLTFCSFFDNRLLPSMFSAFYRAVDNERLWRAECEIPLTPKAFRRLRKEVLLQALWPDTRVVENALMNRYPGAAPGAGR